MPVMGGNSCYSSHAEAYREAVSSILSCMEDISDDLEDRTAAEDILNNFDSTNNDKIHELAMNYWHRIKINPDEWYGASKWAVQAFVARIKQMKECFDDLLTEDDEFSERLDELNPLLISEFRGRVFYKDY